MLIKSADDKSKRLALLQDLQQSPCWTPVRICAHYREKISFPEGKFCWNNAKRFDGLQYCREHQGLFT